MSFWRLPKKLGVESVKFAIYLAVPIALVVVTALPSVRDRLLDQVTARRVRCILVRLRCSVSLTGARVAAKTQLP